MVSVPVKIAVTGTHSTGKTTFLTRLRRDLEHAGYTVASVADLGERAARHGFPILYRHTPESTLWIMTRGISLELQAALNADVVLVDRPVSDALGYYRAAVTYRGEQWPPPAWASYLLHLASHHTDTYDLVLKTKLDPTIPLGDSRPRDHDTRFRALADQAIGDVLSELDVPYRTLTPGNSGSINRLSRDLVRSTVATGLPRPKPRTEPHQRAAA